MGADIGLRLSHAGARMFLPLSFFENQRASWAKARPNMRTSSNVL
jgi:hypothetical protein